MLAVVRQRLFKSRSSSHLHTPSESSLPLGQKPRQESQKLFDTFQLTNPQPYPFPSLWTTQLPASVFQLIIDHYLSHDILTLKALSSTCRIMSSYCRKYIFRTIIIGSRGVESNLMLRDVSSAARFVSVLQENPDVVDYVEELQVVSQKDRKRPRTLTYEDERLCFLLTRPFKNLCRMRLSLSANWMSLPIAVQDAVCMALRLPFLTELFLDGIQAFPGHLLIHVANLKELECRGDTLACGEVFSSSIRPKPEVIALADPSTSTVHALFGDHTALDLGGIHTLILQGSGKVVSILARYLASFRNLRCLEVYAGKLSGVPSTLPLTHSSSLTSLTLSTDVVLPSSFSRSNSEARFQWLISTLQTCHQPSLIQDITIIFATNDLRQTNTYDWKHLDSVFSSGARWPELRVFNVTMCTQLEYAAEPSSKLFFGKFLHREMRNLVARGVVLDGKFETLDIANTTTSR